MNKIASREFQLNYQRLDEPVTVMARSRTLGTWYPKGTDPADDETLVQPPDAWALLEGKVKDSENEIKYLKSELAKRLTTKVAGPAFTNLTPAKQPGFGHSTPAPKP